MKPIRLLPLVLLFCLLPLLGRPAASTGEPGPEKAKAPPVPEKAQAESGKLSVTHHSIDIPSGRIDYTASAGLLPITDDAGKPKAFIFFTSYAKQGGPGGRARPVTFVFNGGPGAASVFLHMAAAGPKRVRFQEGKATPPPYLWETNNATWLAFTDLVFIDPVGTGFSRPAPGVKAEEFFGVKEDVRSAAAFIRAYCTRFDRWLSPKLIAGESYGTTRAAALSAFLQTAGITVNGLILISPVLDFQTISFERSNDLACVLYLPAYACAAWYHKKTAAAGSSDLAAVRAEAEGFAAGAYRKALFAGDSLGAGERDSVVEKLSALTGLSKGYIRGKNLRITRDDFVNELLREEHLTVGVVDSRMTASYEVKRFLDDPGIFYLIGPLVAGWNDYVERELRYKGKVPYEFLSSGVGRSWKWGSAQRGYVDVAPSLASAMKKEPSLKVFLASGYYDLDTSYFATVYSVDHLGLGRALRRNLTLSFFPAGHQVYTDPASLKKLTSDVAAFVGESLKARAP